MGLNRAGITNPESNPYLTFLSGKTILSTINGNGTVRGDFTGDNEVNVDDSLVMEAASFAKFPLIINGRQVNTGLPALTPEQESVLDMNGSGEFDDEDRTIFLNDIVEVMYHSGDPRLDTVVHLTNRLIVGGIAGASPYGVGFGVYTEEGQERNKNFLFDQLASVTGQGRTREREDAALRLIAERQARFQGKNFTARDLAAVWINPDSLTPLPTQTHTTVPQQVPATTPQPMAETDSTLTTDTTPSSPGTNNTTKNGDVIVTYITIDGQRVRITRPNNRYPSGETWEYLDANGNVTRTVFHATKCLSPHTKISTLSGRKRVFSIKIGDIVLTDNGEPVRVKKIGKKRAINHKVLKIKFDDGSVFEISGNHPTADGRLLKDLVVDDIVDGRKVVSIRTIKYRYKYTYDILPDSPTGNYYANGILIGSTLSESTAQPNISEFALVGSY